MNLKKEKLINEKCIKGGSDSFNIKVINTNHHELRFYIDNVKHYNNINPNTADNPKIYFP